ncbi:hypothetical protein SASPL_145123 [Salvia splendens]|uniref:DYW domain-containing protein n=1 Tax=Salvia splendens TaxID=180675 RepID=A0A8X8WHN6_SALSN|nr:hypothetical protein SASPL_145123 [Salvia splendens]
MIDIHRIVPTSSHRACMIDLYGRAGLLNEAQHFILNMSIEPDIIACASLLEFEMVISIEPNNSGAYSALANVYSACGKWEEAIHKDLGGDQEDGICDSVLHDLDEELKEQLLQASQVGNDCHSTIKYISKLVGREIVVRDPTRFHHFKNEACSCRDYW